MKILFVTLLLSITMGTEWLTNFETAKATALKEDKYILLNFSGSDWCAPCIKLKQEVFESETFKTLAVEKLVLVRADFPRAKKNQLSEELKRHNEALAEKYNPEGKFPFTLLLDSNGKIVKKWDGYVFASQDKLIEEISKAVAAK
jgi:thioredoxin-related protein